MELFHPAQLAWIVLASVVMLYFLIRRRAVDVSSHLLWQRVAQQQNVWRRAQRWISATLIVLLLAILAFVLAEPYWKSQQRTARTIVVVIETGKAAAEEGLQAARRSALALVDGMQLYERMAVVVGGGPPHVTCPLTDDRVKLRQAIEVAKPASGANSNIDAADLAHWMIAAQPNPTVIVLSGDAKSDAGAIAASAVPPSGAAPGVWLLVAALALCGGEWVLFSRRITV